MQFQKAKYWIVLMFASLLVACSSSGPESVAEKYISSMMAGDVDGALKMAHVGEGRPAEREEMKGKLSMLIGIALMEVEASGGLKSVKTLSTKYSNNKQEAAVNVEMKMGNGDTRTDIIRLRKINNNWKVVLDNFKL